MDDTRKIYLLKNHLKQRRSLTQAQFDDWLRSFPPHFHTQYIKQKLNPRCCPCIFDPFSAKPSALSPCKSLCLSSYKMGAGREVQTSLDGVRDKNLMQLKKLNSVLFPVRYNDKYYADALASGEFTKLGSVSLLGLIFCFNCLGFSYFVFITIFSIPLHFNLIW